MFKRFRYSFLIVAALMLLSTSIFSQNRREQFDRDIDQVYDILKKDPEKAVDMATQAFKKIKDSDDEYLKMIGFVRLGYVSYKVRDYDAAYLNYTEALNRVEKLDTVDLHAEFAILQHLGMIFSKFKNYDQSIEFRKKSLDVMREYVDDFPDLVESRGLSNSLSSISYFLASEYEKKGAHQTAGRLLADLWEQAEDQEDLITHARVLNKLGLIKKDNGEYSDAIEYFSLVATAQEVSDLHKAIAYNNLGETYMIQGELERSENYFLLAMSLWNDMDKPRHTFEAYMGLGQLEYKKGNMREAIAFWENGLDVFDKVEGEPELYSVYNWLQLAYMDIDIEKAKTFNQTFAQLNNFYVRNQSFRREEEAQRREALSMLIDKEKQRRIDADQRERFIEQFWPVFLGVGLLVLFSIILGIRYYVALRANKILSGSQLKLERAKAILRSADADLED